MIEWLPRDKREVVNDALPLLRDRSPICTPPSKKRTVPVGVPEPGATAATFAVKVTFCFTFEGLRDEPSVVVVAAMFTAWLTGADALARKFDEPA